MSRFAPQLPGAPGALLSAKVGGDHRFYVPDMQGHVRQVTDIDGDAIAEYQYDAWGLIQLTAASAMAFGDWGYAWDGKPGRYYVQQRHLRADLGRWMSVDPVETEPPYAYVGNRPTWAVDPSGEQGFGDVRKAEARDLAEMRARAQASRGRRVTCDGRPSRFGDDDLDETGPFGIVVGALHSYMAMDDAVNPQPSWAILAKFAAQSVNERLRDFVEASRDAPWYTGLERMWTEWRRSGTPLFVNLAPTSARKTPVYVEGFCVGLGQALDTILATPRPMAILLDAAKVLNWLRSRTARELWDFIVRKLLSATAFLSLPLDEYTLSNWRRGSLVGQLLVTALVVAVTWLATGPAAARTGMDSGVGLARTGRMSSGRPGPGARLPQLPAGIRTAVRELDEALGAKAGQMESDLRDGVQAAARSRVGLGIYERYRVATTPWGRKVWQLRDVDWDYIRPDGRTNAQAATTNGAAPQRVGPSGSVETLDVAGERAELHHLGAEERTALAEVWSSVHEKHHRRYGVPQESFRRDVPAEEAFNAERKRYWRWRVRSTKGRT